MIEMSNAGVASRTTTIMRSALVCTALFLAYPAPAGAQQGWSCDLDLHQGDKGRIELTRTQTAITGSVTVERGGSPTTHAVSGTWDGESVSFTRTLSPTSMQPFRGVAVAASDGTIKMAGRFAFEYEGVWSAACRSQAAPPAPTRDVGTVNVNPPVVVAVPPRATCSISGNATGPRASVASAFGVMLLGPNSATKLHSRKPLGSGQYSFTNLPAGSYVVAADTKADVAVRVNPPRHTVVCQGSAITGVNFDFR